MREHLGDGLRLGAQQPERRVEGVLMLARERRQRSGSLHPAGQRDSGSRSSGVRRGSA
jgi:hypothetical protein